MNTGLFTAQAWDQMRHSSTRHAANTTTEPRERCHGEGSVRLFQVMAGGRHGGAEAFFTRLAVAFQEAGLSQTLSLRPFPERTAEIDRAGVPFVPLRFGGPVDLLSSWRLRREIHAFAPGVVLAWMNRAAFHTPPGDYLRIGRLGGYYNLKYYRGFDHLIGNTRDIVDYIVSFGWDPARVHYLPNFVELPPLPATARHEFDTPESVPLALVLGRLHRNKAIDSLIAAIASCGSLHLWIAGDGPERAALEAQARAAGTLDRIRFLGWREDAAALLAACDILVCPSRHEPLGNVILEGWAAAKPVVAAASQGPSALVSHEETGLLVPIDNPPAMAEALERVTGDKSLASSLAAAGHASYKADYTRDIVVKRYLTFFATILERRWCVA